MKRFALVSTLLIMSALPPMVARAEPPARWVYAPCNFQVNERVDDLIALTERAATAGYNGMVVADWKFGRIDDRPPHYYANLKRFRESASRLKIEVIPCVMPIGYSGSILSNNPNLAEGIAVRDCELLVRGGRATVADTTNLLDGGAFERGSDAKPAPGWDWVDGPGVSSLRDTAVRHGGAAAIRMQDFRKGNEYGNCRLCRKVSVKPWQQYEVRLWIRSQGAEPAGDVKVAVLADKNRSLNFTNLQVKPTQDWTEHAIVFNSMEH
ncbi:MAG: hypothetical protein JXL80_06495, partial [Planctomycetes bacterium]|nr:hypothetical protein [Planctomycetota bacterium]